MTLISSFDQEDAVRLNEARRAFTERVVRGMICEGGIRTAIDIGCGYGYFSARLHELGLEVTGLDIRQRNVDEAKRRYPHLQFQVADIERILGQDLGAFDLVFCFGLLYHLENPFRALRALHSLTKKYLLIETQVWPSRSPLTTLYEEFPADNQSQHYVAWIPSKSAVVMMLYQAGFSSVYYPDQPPDHEEFRARIMRRRMREMLLATKNDQYETRCWGGVTFEGMAKPQQFQISRNAWDTALGRSVRVFTEPKKTCLRLFDRVCHLIPRSVGLALSQRMAMPIARDLNPGWCLGAGEPRGSASTFVRRALWRWFSVTRPGEFLLNWHHGMRVIAYPQDEVCRALFLTGYFEPNELIYLDQVLKPGMTVIDAGAHMGLYTLFASAKIGEQGVVVSIEPSGRERRRLVTHLALNHIQNVRVRSEALSNCHAQAEFLIAAGGHSGHNTLGEFAYETTQVERTEFVVTERLSEIVQQEGLLRIDLIKMDIEGSEFLALDGAREVLQRYRPILLLEISDRALQHRRCHSSGIWELLERYGYVMYRFDLSTGQPISKEKEDWFDGENILALPT